MKIVFVESIIRNSLCIIYVFLNYFFQKSVFTENYFLMAAINLATRGPLYTCLVLFQNHFWPKNIFAQKVLIDWNNCWDKFDTRGPLYTSLVYLLFHLFSKSLSLVALKFYRNLSHNRYHLSMQYGYVYHAWLCVIYAWLSMNICEFLLFSEYSHARYRWKQFTYTFKRCH